MNTLYKTYLAIAIGCTILFSACKTEYPDLPYAEIETFTIEDAHGQPLRAVIKDAEIIIYWTPLEEEPETIRPVITLSEGATISPASGEAVPYSAATAYTVTAQDGSKKTYTLRPEGGQPIPYLHIPSTEIYINSTFSILGDYFVPDAERTKVYIIANGQEHELTEFRQLTNSVIQPFIPLSTPLDTGYYELKVVTGRYTLTAPERMHLNAPNLAALLDKTRLPSTLTPGQVLSLYFTEEQALKFYENADFTAQMFYYSDNSAVEFDPNVKFVNAAEIQITIPAGINTGSVWFNLTAGNKSVIGQQMTIE